METLLGIGIVCELHSLSPHSLGKLIEWKHGRSGSCGFSWRGPHSLGKLIEWKLILIRIVTGVIVFRSPLAGETN